MRTDTGAPLEGANTAAVPLGTTEEENSHGKDGGAGRLQNQSAGANWCLGAAASFRDSFFTVTMAHRYLRLSSGCRNMFRLLLSPKVELRQVGRKH